ncbi:MAG: hypothetical protein DMG05_18130 [Acidobacteria bacterium]|nr:MAG: hypothetical protein DMG05_18130 [Acidobacteriota bacterium]
MDRNENSLLVYGIVVVLVLVVVLGFLDRGGAGTLCTLENARRSVRSTRDIKGEALSRRLCAAKREFCSRFLNSRPSPGSLLKAPMLSPPVRGEGEE